MADPTTAREHIGYTIGRHLPPEPLCKGLSPEAFRILAHWTETRENFEANWPDLGEGILALVRDVVVPAAVKLMVNSDGVWIQEAHIRAGIAAAEADSPLCTPGVADI